MSRDPYHDFASDLRTSLSTARALSQTYTSLLANPPSSSQNNSLQDAHDRLGDAIEGLRQDVQDVRESVAIVQRAGAERFGVGVEELEGRVRFVSECEAEIEQLLAEQDSSLGLLGRTLSTLKDQASHLGQEINEHVELLGALDEEVDVSQSRLKRAMDRMETLVRLGDGRLGGWCVWILVVVLFLLLLVAVLI
ncbi:unnamed protein product [Tilletia controversa]|nr:unnamed protein product [Tilletia controversa]